MSSVAGSKRRRSAADRWWENPEVAVPLIENNPARQRRRQRRVMKIYLYAAALLFPFLLLTLIILGAQKINGTVSAPSTVAQTQQTETSALAQIQLEQWLTTTPAPVAGGRILALIGATSTPPPPPQRGETASDAALNTYVFTVTDSAQLLYRASLQMSVSPTTGVHMVATPALLPVPPISSAVADSQVWPWPGVESGSKDPAYASAVTSWAAAYTSGDASALKQVVGDPDENRGYLPLTGVAFSGVAMTQVGDLWGKDQKPQQAGRPQRVLIRVQAQQTVVTPGASAGSSSSVSSSSDSAAATVTYDLLLDRANTATPVVVAWGSPGAVLQPYSNAIVGQDTTAMIAQQQAQQQAEATAQQARQKAAAAAREKAAAASKQPGR